MIIVQHIIKLYARKALNLIGILYHSKIIGLTRIGPLSLQPGEFSKIMLLLLFAQLLATKRSLFQTAGYQILGLDFPRLRDLAPILGV